jgi:sulfite reductase (NADPH) hemoprotein beta-component
VAVPPSNDVDIFAHDLGFIAILDDAGAIAGWNVTVGGGMGMTHGEPDTYPRTADVMGFCATRGVIKVAEAVVTVQRDWGDRSNRKHARLKYTIEDRGLDAFRAEVEKRSCVKLDLARPYEFTSTGDRYGWTEGDGGVDISRCSSKTGAFAMPATARSSFRRCAASRK